MLTARPTMKVTAREEYGFRCMVQLARAGPGRRVACRSIARGEGLSAAYTQKLLNILKRAGLVDADRGVRGGYRLSREPGRITAAEVLRALEGRIFDSDFCRRFSGLKSRCIHERGSCAVRSVWSTLGSWIEQALDQTTLAELVAGTEPALREALRSRFARSRTDPSCGRCPEGGRPSHVYADSN